jgi:hypothetical protein
VAAQFYDTTAVLEDPVTEITANTVTFTKSSVSALTGDEWTGLDGFPHPKGWTVTINGITREITQVQDFGTLWDIEFAGSAITYSVNTDVRITKPLPIIWKQVQWKGSVIEDDVRNSLTESEIFANPPGTVQDGVVITTSGGSKDVIELIPSGTNRRIKLTAPTTEVSGMIKLSSAGATGGEEFNLSTALDLTKSIQKLSNGYYSLANGVEGQIMYFVPVNGVTQGSSVGILIANVRQFINGTVGVQNNGWFPFFQNAVIDDGTAVAFNASTIAYAIFTDGAWNVFGGGMD